MRRFLAVIFAAVLALTSLSAAAVEPENTKAKELFSKYINDIYGSVNYMHYEELGKVGDNTCAYGAYSEATDTFYNAVLGDYVFNKFYIAFPYELGLYIITDNSVLPLETAYGAGVIKDEDLPTVVSLTQRVNVRKMTFEEKAVYKHIKNKGLYTSSNYSYNYIGSIGDGLSSVVAVQTKDYNYSETIGDYQVFSDPEPWHFAMGTQLFIVGDLELNENAVWSLKDACDNDIVKIQEVKNLCESKYVNGVIFGPVEQPTEPSSSEPESSNPIPSEPESTSATEASSQTDPPAADAPKPVVKKHKTANTMKVSTKTKAVKYKKLKKAKQTVAPITVKKAQGKVSYKKLSGSKNLTLKSNGQIVVKKGTKKGTYTAKIKVTAKGTSKYKSSSKTVFVKIKVI